MHASAVKAQTTVLSSLRRWRCAGSYRYLCFDIPLFQLSCFLLSRFQFQVLNTNCDGNHRMGRGLPYSRYLPRKRETREANSCLIMISIRGKKQTRDDFLVIRTCTFHANVSSGASVLPPRIAHAAAHIKKEKEEIEIEV